MHGDTDDLFDALTCDPLDLIERGGAALADRTRWPQRLTELFDIELAFSRRTMANGDAAEDAAARTILIADYLGGSVIYLPRGGALRQAVRDALIYTRFTGANHDALAREFGLTTAAVYKILQRETARRKSKMQGRLFNG